MSATIVACPCTETALVNVENEHLFVPVLFLYMMLFKVGLNAREWFNRRQCVYLQLSSKRKRTKIRERFLGLRDFHTILFFHNA